VTGYGLYDSRWIPTNDRDSTLAGSRVVPNPFTFLSKVSRWDLGTIQTPMHSHEPPIHCFQAGFWEILNFIASVSRPVHDPPTFLSTASRPVLGLTHPPSFCLQTSSWTYWTVYFLQTGSVAPLHHIQRPQTRSITRPAHYPRTDKSFLLGTEVTGRRGW
jgi:hypothetical protein